MCLYQFPILRDWSLITGRGGGYKMGKSWVRNFPLPPPSRQGKTFRAPPFKEWKLFAPPLQYGYNFKLLRKNYPKTFCAPPSAWLKLFPPPPFHRGKLHVPPPLPFCSPPPLPVISDQSLRALPLTTSTWYSAPAYYICCEL